VLPHNERIVTVGGTVRTSSLAGAEAAAAADPCGPDGEPAGLAAGAVDGRQAAQLRRHELGAFLRDRRERIAPQQVGLTPVGRRRTPGLRREELAQLAGVGVTWYTWLEQGRDINVSPQVLESVCRTLMLDPHERSHVMTLAAFADQRLAQECQSISPAVQTMLDGLVPIPAAVQNARFDVLAYNRVYGRLFDDLDALPLCDRNTLWLLFTHPAWRRGMAEWEQNAHRVVAQYRLAMADHVGEPAWRALIARLSDASPEFVRVWEEHEVLGPENQTKLIMNGKVGLLRVESTHYWLGPRPGSQLVVYTPADADCRERLEKLAAVEF
jgi:transcriptional regulator with XRE-family HTH domain